MLFVKTGFPEEDELVLCTVANIQHHSVFATLDEYPGKQGMLHISEVSPGRIRNIRDFVVEGKKIVCKVLKVNQEKGYIDLSLRRVNEMQRIKKMNDIKMEQMAEKIIELSAKELKINFEKLYNELKEIIFKKYPDMRSCFTDASVNDGLLEEIGVQKKTSDILTEQIKSRIKPPEVIIGGELKLKSHAPNGIDIIKDALKKSENKKEIIIKYLGGGRFSIEIISSDYKSAEKLLKDLIDSVTNHMKKTEGECEFVRKE